MTDRELLGQALDGIDWLRHHLTQHHGCLHMNPTASGIPSWLDKTEIALRERLAQPEQEPVYQVSIKSGPASTAWIDCDEVTYNSAALLPNVYNFRKLYTRPQAREPLTDEQIEGMLPPADGSAEENKVSVEVQPGMWGVEYEEVDAWSLPLVRQAIRAVEAAHGIGETK